MKACKFLSIAAVAVLLLAPATAMAKTHFSISLNLFQHMAPFLAPRAVVVPPPIPVCYYPVYQQHTVIKEYHYYPEHVVIQDISPAYYPHTHY